MPNRTRAIQVKSANTISIVICTRNRVDDTLRLIRNLAHQTRIPEQIIIVDASDNRRLPGRIKDSHYPFEIVCLHSSPGLTYQRNMGFDNSVGDLVFFFDDDVLPESDYIEQIENVFVTDTENRIGGVMGRIVVDKTWLTSKSLAIKIKHRWVSIVKTIFLHNKSGNGMFRLSGFPTHPQDLHESRYIECLSGGCVAFRRGVFDYIRFDENLRMYAYMEDSDISKQLLDAGYKAYYQASARIRHYKSRSGRLNHSELRRMAVVHYYYLFRKNWPQNTLRKAAFWWAILGFVILHIRHMEELRGVLDGIRIILKNPSPLIALKHVRF